ncbi:MAG TPA: DUF4382 domain-containing protein [bacterium]|nr:DUF4382 domain-containing protein [bacterium]
MPKYLQVILINLLLVLVAWSIGCDSGSSAADDDDDAAGDDDDAATGDDDDATGDDDDATGDDDDALDDDDVTGDDDLSFTAPFLLKLIDAPVDEAEAVYITLTQIRVHLAEPYYAGDDDTADDDVADDDVADDDVADDDDAKDADDDAADDDAADDDDDGDGEWIDLDFDPTRYNLLELQNNVSALLADEELPAGLYSQIRLMFDCEENPPSIVIDGEESALTIPSGCNNGIRLTNQFTLVPGEPLELIMDFDVRKSVHQTGNGKYMMRPTVRLVNAGQSGSIGGSVLPLQIGAVVYAFSSGTYQPEAKEDAFDDAENSAIVSEGGSFTLGALPAGSYDLVVTADGYQTAVQAGLEVTAGEELAATPIEMTTEP